MASNVPLSPTCQECSELYTDPRMLPCLDSFCKKCIEKFVEEQGSKQAIKCPTCNEEAAIPPGGVDAIPCDVRASYEAEVKRFELKITSTSGEKCGRCVRTGNGPAVSFCINCCKFLCKICKEDHTQWLETLSHELVDTGVTKKEHGDKFTTVLAPKPVACGQHPDEVLKFYCETCETLTCRDCITLEHRDHTYNRLEKVAEKEKADLLSSMEGASEAKQKVEDAMRKREKLTQHVEQRKKVVNEAITNGFNQLRQAIDKREETLLAKSNEIGLGKTSTLAIENEELKRMLDRIESTCQFISRAVDTYTPNQVLSTKKLMKAKLLAHLKAFQEKSLEPITTASMPMTLDVSSLVSELATLGAVAGGSCPWMASADILYIPRAVVNKERKIKVTARDEAGKPYPHGGEIVKVSCSILGSNDPPIDGTTTDNGDGTYIISFRPTTTGEHELKLSISGQLIKGSPFIISVHQERAYQSFSGHQQYFSTAALPWDVAIHDNGDLYVADYGAHCIYVLTSTGTHKLSFGTQGDGQGQFKRPSGIAIRGDVVFVAENNNNRVQKLTIKGEHLAFIGQGQLSNPRGICLDPSGRIFVADYSNNRVQVFNEDGSHAYSITGSSTEGSNLSSPWGIAFDAEGQLHVVNCGSYLVQIFTADGKYVTTYGSGQFIYSPAGIAIDEEGYSFITEYYQCCNGYLKIFNPQHQCIHSTTCTNAYFNYPAGVVIDKEGCVWVADYSNNCIKKF